MSDVEQTILTILRTHLAEPEMDIDDDFYAMGGDSLSALRVVADANNLGIPIELRDVLCYSTARKVSAAVDARDQKLTGVRDVQRPGLLDPFDRAMVSPGVQKARPASALQLGLIYLHETAHDPSLYNDLIGLEVSGQFNERCFALALTWLCERHEALRSSFDIGGFSEPMQLVWSSVPSPLSVEWAQTAEVVTRWRQRQLDQSPDWKLAPLFRCHVAALPYSFHITIATPHAVIDGWSYARLVTELLQLYEAALTDHPANLPPVPTDGHERFVALERAALECNASAEFWQAEADVPPLLFNCGRGCQAADPAEKIAFTIDLPTLERLHRAAADIGVPLKSLVVGCHAGALGQWTGRKQDVVTGLTVNGRPEITGADLLIGLFINTVPIRFRAPIGGWAELGRAALAAEQQTVIHRRYPLAHIDQRLGRPSFDVSLNYTHFHAYRQLDSLRQLHVNSWWSFDKASFPVMVDFMIDSRKSGTGVEVAYDSSLVTRERVGTYADLFRNWLLSAANRAL